MPTFYPEALETFVRQTYKALGASTDDAALIADSLVKADLWGHPSHGVMRTFWYAKRIQSGAIKLNRAPQITSQLGGLIALDGQDGMGQLVAQRAVDLAAEAAKTHGIAAVSVANSGHFGTAMYFTRQLAKRGMIGFLSTNASPAMAPWGGMEKRLGNNPWSWAAPAGRHPAMVLDIANTAVARGKLYVAKQEGRAIPAGWAIDSQGRATLDASAGIDGTILPMAGHKGYGITALMDVLSGVLSGSGFARQVIGPYVPDGRSGVGHLVIAINIAALRPVEAFEADMEALIEDLKSCPRQPGVEEIFYPGELEARSEQRLVREGINLPEKTVEDFILSARKLGISHPF